MLMLAAVTTAAAAVPTALTVGEPVPAAFAQARVVDLDGATHPLADAWRDRPAVLIFLRHFG